MKSISHKYRVSKSPLILHRKSSVQNRKKFTARFFSHFYFETFSWKKIKVKHAYTSPRWAVLFTHKMEQRLYPIIGSLFSTHRLVKSIFSYCWLNLFYLIISQTSCLNKWCNSMCPIAILVQLRFTRAIFVL